MPRHEGGNIILQNKSNRDKSISEIPESLGQSVEGELIIVTQLSLRLSAALFAHFASLAPFEVTQKGL